MTKLRRSWEILARRSRPRSCWRFACALPVGPVIEKAAYNVTGNLAEEAIEGEKQRQEQLISSYRSNLRLIKIDRRDVLALIPSLSFFLSLSSNPSIPFADTRSVSDIQSWYSPPLLTSKRRVFTSEVIYSFAVQIIDLICVAFLSFLSVRRR